jgi:hypothetical protein
MGEYVPKAPVNDEAKKHNQNLPGLGGVFNYVNLHAYHYAGNNPVNITDPTGAIDEKLLLKILNGTSDFMSVAGEFSIFYSSGVDLITKGKNLIRSGNANFWTSPFGMMGAIGAGDIAKGGRLLSQGNTARTAGITGYFLSGVSYGITGGIFVHQITDGDTEGALGTLGNFFGSSMGSKAGAAVATLIIGGTGGGTGLIIVFAIGGGWAGGKLGEEYVPKFAKMVTEILNNIEVRQYSQEEIKKMVSASLAAISVP